MVLLSKKLIYSAFYLLITLLSMAGLFVFAGADFLAVAQIMVYVGGVLVLLIFGIMLTQQQVEVSKSSFSSYAFFGLGLSVLAGSALIYVISQAEFPVAQSVERNTTVKDIGVLLMTEHLFAFELAALLLLAALIGASLLAWKKGS